MQQRWQYLQAKPGTDQGFPPATDRSPEVITDAILNPEEAQMASTKREVLDNIPLLLVAAMAAMGLFSFFSVILG